MGTAFLDTCVLYPATLRDVLLSLAEADQFEPMWSEQVLDELDRNLARMVGRASSAKLIVALRAAFGDAIVTGFEHRIEDMTNHWKDRHVLAAAVHSRAGVLVTANLKDFPQRVPETGSQVLHPDEFLVGLFHADQTGILDVLAEMVAFHRREPRTLDGLLASLAKSVPQFSEAVRRHPSRHAE